ncbi:hypothetical protein SAMN02982927_00693 [Sporolactobacillus nakayamae]|uniref:Phage head-tail adaptor, putative, SPP1 family n=2 Tax=Sporolactobacillus nakayamae TaxID=269670 RepID=A0A1I2P3E0_9BACL|nr:hypothetical protein SAMN02982927_00693 [Sporolactobacillus nakayamae]
MVMLMFKDVVTLIKTRRERTKGGGFKEVIDAQRDVFAGKQSAGRTEFYMAAQADLQVEKVFKIRIMDYQDERTLLNEGACYSIIRDYEKGDFVYLTCQKRLGGLDEVLS